MTRATVVVPTRDRPEPLRACLAAIEAQTEPDVEIVVVDDASRTPVALEPGTRARVLRADGSGPAAARNLGATAAAGDIVCFTDDDCRPAPGWIAALVRQVDAGAAVVAGPTRVPAGAGPCATAAQIVTNHLVGPRFAPTSNLAVRADLFAQHPFDESFPLAAGEDRAWCTALAEPIAWAADAVVWHHPELDLRAFWRQQQRYGRGAHRFRQATGASLSGPRFYADLLRKGFGEGPRVGALVALAQLATAAGIAREATAYATMRRRGARAGGP